MINPINFFKFLHALAGRSYNHTAGCPERIGGLCKMGIVNASEHHTGFGELKEFTAC